MKLSPKCKGNGAVPLNYKQYGAGRPLIILHGLFGSHKNWVNVCKKLSRHFAVYALDLRNHGDSPHSPVFDYAVLTADLNAFMERFGIKKAILLGHSLGGKVAMAFTMACPEKVSRLIVADISPGAYGGEHRALIEALVRLDLDACTRQQDILKALEPDIPSIEIRYFLLTNIVRDSNDRFVWKSNLDAIAANFDGLQAGLPLTRPFNRPTLFLKGECSNYIRLADLPLIAWHFPASVVETVSGAGHWLHLEATEKFIEKVTAFCRNG